MSILIKKEMPQNCTGCPICCGLPYQYRDEKGRRPDCPLIELPPHGRLIDIKSVEYGKFTAVGNEYQRWWNGALESVIDNAPTVIEAEGSETE